MYLIQILSILLISGIYASNQCPEKWSYFEKTDGCYHLNNFTNDENDRWKMYTAKEAEEKCKEWESHLVSIHSKDEDDFLQELIKSNVKELKDGHNPCFFQYAWIGLRGNGKANSGSWTDDTPVDYTSYAKAEELDNKFWKIGNDESCQIQGWAWSGEEAHKNARFICKKQNKIMLAN
ncbi:unnamed protein product, partial [Mesorhabditis belari]|uniref:C-type lectin domain-containing protein n=1 Tax=Mesorhabditis belari TaxID=2138241 RepID=A0A915GSK6_9BILA